VKSASVISTKGRPGKTTVTATPGAFCADSNIRTLLIDLDTQRSFSSFYRISDERWQIEQLSALDGERLSDWLQ
jgi:chromosome partitioning related protein ParA